MPNAKLSRRLWATESNVFIPLKTGRPKTVGLNDELGRMGRWFTVQQMVHPALPQAVAVSAKAPRCTLVGGMGVDVTANEFQLWTRVRRVRARVVRADESIVARLADAEPVSLANLAVRAVLRLRIAFIVRARRGE